jgi:hypothetical protein
VRLSDRAQAELRAGEALVFDWTALAFCCAVAGEVTLRPTTLQQAQRSSIYVPLWSGNGPVVFAHRRAYPLLVGRDIQIDAGAAWASARSPPRCHPTSGCARRSDANPATDPVPDGRARRRALLLRAADAQLNPAGWWLSRASCGGQCGRRALDTTTLPENA